MMPKSPPVADSVPALAPFHDCMLLPVPQGVAGETDGGLAVVMPLGNRSVKDRPVMAVVALLVIVMLMLAAPVAGLNTKLLAMVGVALTIRVAEAAAVLLPALLVDTAPAARVLT